jgi:protein-export membrane protein SecD
MARRDIQLLILIVLVALFAGYIAWPTDPGLGFLGVDREIKIYQGLDLQGGVQVLLEADVPEGQEISSDDMEAARTIVESRVNGLGVSEPTVQRVGSRRIQVELPGIEDAQEAIEILRETGLMEWIASDTLLLPGTVVQTDYLAGDAGATSATNGEATPEAATPAAEGEAEAEASEDTARVFHTVLTGRNLRTATVTFDPQTNAPLIAFELDAEGGRIFAEHTANNVGKYLAIALDKQVISSPRINEAIPSGSGVIEGQFTIDEARALVLQLRYGALPIPLREVETRGVGPTLGQDSIQKSVRAGAIGLSIVLLFMLIYYRLPGLLADLALIIYAIITVAVYKLIPVTLTLPGIAGFLLSVGMAVDANILIFERVREELRQGRTLARAIDVGFRRAWTSILDSNISTWITCGILWAFGNTFGASVVKGFALTLGIGVAISMFTAVTVTRTFLRSAFAVTGERLREAKWLLGV